MRSSIDTQPEAERMKARNAHGVTEYNAGQSKSEQRGLWRQFVDYAARKLPAVKANNSANTAAPPAVAITISPTSATVRVKQTKQFTATVQNTANTSVTWKVNGIVGGNGTVGTISTSRVYRAPNSAPNPAVVSVSATSNADPTKSATASVTITRH